MALQGRQVGLDAKRQTISFWIGYRDGATCSGPSAKRCYPDRSNPRPHVGANFRTIRQVVLGPDAVVRKNGRPIGVRIGLAIHKCIELKKAAGLLLQGLLTARGRQNYQNKYLYHISLIELVSQLA